LEFIIKFPIQKHEKTLQNLAQSGRRAMSKFELLEIQFEKTVRDKIVRKTQLVWENDYFKNIFGILIKFSIQFPEKTQENLVQSGRQAVSKFELLETQFERTVRNKLACIKPT